VPSKQKRKREVSSILKELSVSDLWSLCNMLKLRRSGGKKKLIQTLVSSQYELSEVLRMANEIRLADQLAVQLTKKELREHLRTCRLTVSGSKKELALRLIANRVFDGPALLGELSPDRLSTLHFSIFGRVPTTSKNHVIEEILRASGLISAEPPSEETARSRDMRDDFQYDIALSFAGEDREIAKEIYEKLSATGIEVFFDEVYQAELWGKNLPDEFQQRYGPKTRFVLPLISRHYAVKDWTDFEFTIAREEARRRSQEFILPVRLDNTPLVGLKSGIAYLDLRKTGVDGVVTIVLEKLDRKGQARAEASQSPRFEDRGKGFARLVFFFRRHGAKIERFAISWVNPETLHQVEINAEIQYEGKGELGSVLVKLVVDNRLTTEPSSHSLSFRDLNVLVDGRSMPVKFAQFPWRGHKGVPLFKSVPQRLFGTDMPIFFKKEWVEDENPPFFYWELHAPDREPSRGFVRVKRDGEDLILVPTSVPAIGAFQQNGRSRSFLTDPDLSFGP